MSKIDRIRELVEELNKAVNAYYKYDNPIMTDKQYDDLYDELSELENETGYILTGSPTQKVQGEVVDFLEKVEHKYPMLSSNKTKDLDVVRKFIGDRDVIQSWKLDGLTVVAEYRRGFLYKAVTRGNGTIGEDVTHTFKHCVNLPVQLRKPVDITFRGECVIPWGTFDRINSELEEPYSHPRNLAAGTLRQLDANNAIERKLEYYVFDVIDGFDCGNLIGDYAYASGLDMPVVEHCMVKNLEEDFNKFNPENFRLPVDGIIYRYDDTGYGKSLGTTSHHPLDMLALKWQDQLYETKLTDIEWNTSKTGLINPVAIFNPVDLDGAVTTRATLHNVSYIEDLELGVGDTIMVYRANMVIPKVHENLTKSNTWKLPDKCPCCGGDVEIHNENGSKTLHCCNDVCQAKLLSRLTHYVSKNALNIDGFSEATIEKFMEMGWLTNLSDIYTLHEHNNEMMVLDGFGKKSTEKLLAAIEKSKTTTLERYLYGLSVPLIGKTASKTISKYFKGDYAKFVEALEDRFDFSLLEDFGSTMNKSIHDWYEKYSDTEDAYIPMLLDFNIPKVKSSNGSSVDLAGKIFVVTGSLLHYSNRNELVTEIEGLGGKVSGSVSAKTNYLINNDSMSTSGKNKKAHELNIPIITEEEFLKLIDK
ncbi:NAD-dependent DNA ligase LigA [Lacrimispora amygdalina]|uniref:DNA ligase n=1 Tax=Lacrimispora amygdalina TaxID=253257 RepID=A0A3E2NBH4_9FIRM|nr:NAD-dependent DNA ligase LigA [Clostridium indicum]RFZ78314.1 NAD-dependent DNA ligase LigA [Clostridium indicum]